MSDISPEKAALEPPTIPPWNFGQVPDDAPDFDAPAKTCAVLATYNNEATVREVVEGVRAHLTNIVIVIDGATDSTPDILAELAEKHEGIDLITFPKNRGKGAALRAGLQRAGELGFTHALTIDTDGQHNCDDIPLLLEKSAESPHYLVLGVRDIAQEGRRQLRSRIYRANSNFWMWFATGIWVPDSQTGFRVYPLAPINRMKFTGSRYEFELEVIIKALWMGIPIEDVTVHTGYGPGSESHFAGLSDIVRIFRVLWDLNWQQVIFPLEFRQVMHLRAFRALPWRTRWSRYFGELFLRQSRSPATFGLAVGVGAFFGIFPIWGFQMAAAAVVAHRLRVSVPVTLLASNISFAFMLPIILYLSLLTGRLLLGNFDWRVDPAALTTDEVWLYVSEYLVGAIALSIAAGLAFGAAGWAFARRFFGDGQQAEAAPEEATA